MSIIWNLNTQNRNSGAESPELENTVNEGELRYGKICVESQVARGEKRRVY